MDTDLRRAYGECRRLNAYHGKTYYFATRFFPRELQASVHALYGFVRYADEIVDNPPPGSSPSEALATFRSATLASLSGRCQCRCLPVLDAFADTVRRHDIPAEYVAAFLDAMAMDLTVSRYETFDDLCRYTYGSASAVGLMMARILGAEGPAALQAAHDLGLAMQLTNFWRDIGEDYEARGRIYLPMADMRAFGYTERDLAAGVVSDQFRSLMRYQIERTRRYYACADAGMGHIPARNRVPVRLARLLYARILDKIEENGYDVYRRRAATSRAEKLLVAAREIVATTATTALNP